MWARFSILLLSLFVIHALDVDCLVKDCHCDCVPTASCVVPVTVHSAKTVVAEAALVTVPFDWRPVPATPVDVTFVREQQLPPPRAEAWHAAPPRAPPA